jgi:hypothetical protein
VDSKGVKANINIIVAASGSKTVGKDQEYLNFVEMFDITTE